jgi:hypothetical protein
MKGLYGSVRNGGGVIVTVPQHPFLWSGFDEISHHRRRYTRSGLKKLVEGAGFRVARMTSFVTLLFPFFAASRILARGPKGGKEMDAGRFFALPRIVDRFFGAVSGIERALILGGVSLPFGGSLLCVAYKDASDG